MVGYWFIGLVGWVDWMVGLINWLVGGLSGSLVKLLGFCLNGGLIKFLLDLIIV